MIIRLDGEGFDHPIELLSDYRDLTDVVLRTQSEKGQGIFIAEGRAVISRAAAAGYEFRSVLCEEKWLDSVALLVPETVPIMISSKKTLAEIAGFNVHRGALASMVRRELPSPTDLLNQSDRVLILEGLVNHTNVGAIVRSAAAFGFDALFIDQHCADPLYRRAIRTSMGTIFSLPWTRLPGWPASAQIFRDAGFAIIALTPEPSAQPISRVDLPKRYALVLGTEGDGLQKSTSTAADLLVRIPMKEGIDSLNVAAAAAVAMYAITSGSSAVHSD